MGAKLTLNKKGQIVEKRLKYGNKITEVDGIKFRSKFESEDYQELKIRLKVGDISDLKWQVPIELISNGMIVGKYFADFVYYEKQERKVDFGKPKLFDVKIIHDSKGAIDDLFELKWNILKSMYRYENLIELRTTKKGR